MYRCVRYPATLLLLCCYTVADTAVTAEPAGNAARVAAAVRDEGAKTCRASTHRRRSRLLHAWNQYVRWGVRKAKVR